VRTNSEQQRVAATREETEERRLEGLGLQIERGNVAVEMVDRDERPTARPGDRLRRGEAHEQRADEAGPLRHGDTVDVLERAIGPSQRLSDDGKNELEVVSRGDLGNDASEPCVELGLRGDDGGEHRTARGDERRGRLVAGRLDSEDQEAFSDGVGSRHMMRASSRLSV
jgi:hypothetical protein